MPSRTRCLILSKNGNRWTASRCVAYVQDYTPFRLQKGETVAQFLIRAVKEAPGLGQLLIVREPRSQRRSTSHFVRLSKQMGLIWHGKMKPQQKKKYKKAKLPQNLYAWAPQSISSNPPQTPTLGDGTGQVLSATAAGIMAAQHVALHEYAQQLYENAASMATPVPAPPPNVDSDWVIESNFGTNDD